MRNNSTLNGNISACGLLLELGLRSWHINIPVKAFEMLLKSSKEYNLDSFNYPAYHSLPLLLYPQDLHTPEMLSTDDILNVLSLWNGELASVNYSKVYRCIEELSRNKLPLLHFLGSLQEIYDKMTALGLSEINTVNPLNPLKECLEYIDQNVVATDNLRFYACVIYWVIYQQELIESKAISITTAEFLLEIILHNNNFGFLIDPQMLKSWLIKKSPEFNKNIIKQESDLFKADKDLRTDFRNYQMEYEKDPQMSNFNLKLYSIFTHRKTPLALTGYICQNHYMKAKKSMNETPKLVNILPFILSSTCQFIANPYTFETMSIRGIHAFDKKTPILLKHLPVGNLMPDKEFCYVHPVTRAKYSPLKNLEVTFKSPNDCLAYLSQLFCICQKSQQISCNNLLWTKLYDRLNDKYAPKWEEFTKPPNLHKFSLTTEKASNSSTQSVKPQNARQHIDFRHNLYFSNKTLYFRNKQIAFNWLGHPYSIQPIAKRSMEMDRKNVFLLYDAFTMENYFAFPENVGVSADNENKWIKWYPLSSEKRKSCCSCKVTPTFDKFFKSNKFLSPDTFEDTDDHVDLSTYVEMNKMIKRDPRFQCYSNVVSETNKMLNKLNVITESQIREKYSEAFPILMPKCVLLYDIHTTHLVIAQFIYSTNITSDYFYDNDLIIQALNDNEKHDSVPQKIPIITTKKEIKMYPLYTVLPEQTSVYSEVIA